MDKYSEELASEIIEAFSGVSPSPSDVAQQLLTFDGALNLSPDLIGLRSKIAIAILPEIFGHVLRDPSRKPVNEYTPEMLMRFLNVPSCYPNRSEELRDRDSERELADAKHETLDLLTIRQATVLLAWLEWAERGWAFFQDKDNSGGQIQFEELQAAKQYWIKRVAELSSGS